MYIEELLGRGMTSRFAPLDVTTILIDGVIGVCLAIVCLAIATGLLYLWGNVRWTDFE